MSEVRRCCLTVAGSDSGGNAGVQADLRVFHGYGVHGCTVFSALTAQNPFGVSAIESMSADFVAAQLRAVLGVYDVGGIKTGMLGSAETIQMVAEHLATLPDVAKVVDPVMIATSGARLIEPKAIEALRDVLLPLATVITPNIPEAEVLSGVSISSVDEACSVAEMLERRFGCSVVIKGGHLSSEMTVDVLCTKGSISTFCGARIVNAISTHGTGCSFAAALTAELMLGRPLERAVAGAKAYVSNAISSGYWVGRGCGVLGFVNDVKKEANK